MHSPVMKFLALGSWVITALASINIGLAAMGYDFFQSNFVLTNMMGLIKPMYYIIGIAGLISLVLFIMACMGGCAKCGSKDCKC
jgi:uncharacterized membrane protein YuzA (DUF378 family)